MISLTNHDSQWGRSDVVIIYPDSGKKKTNSLWQSGTSPDWTTRISVQKRGQNVVCKGGQKVARGHPTMDQ